MAWGWVVSGVKAVGAVKAGEWAWDTAKDGLEWAWDRVDIDVDAGVKVDSDSDDPVEVDVEGGAQVGDGTNRTRTVNVAGTRVPEAAVWIGAVVLILVVALTLRR